MGARRADAATLTTTDSTSGANPRGWPIVVRRARDADREAVLAFATNTWNGHDYIPNAWPVWLKASDGAFLVATVGPPGGLDSEGKPLGIGTPIAITRIAMVSDTEAWLEGIRVDPRVRGMGVASDLQVAELHWVAAQRARVVRYATSWRNEASHRLGARDGIEIIARLRSWRWSATGAVDDAEEPSGFDPAIGAAATARRQRALHLARDAGMVAATERDDIDALWHRVETDPTFTAWRRLYEARAWAMAELTQALFLRHVERGEVLVVRGADQRWAVTILVGEHLPSEDAALRLALLVGDGPGAAWLANAVRSAIGEQIRFRVPTDAPMTTGHEDRFRASGFVSPDDWEMHILGRSMADGGRGGQIPALDPAKVVLHDPPQSITPPRW